MDAKTKKRTAAYTVATLLSIITFTPLVIPYGVYEPQLLGMPRTLWVGILLTILLVIVTYFAGRYAPDDFDEASDLPEPSVHPDS